MRPLVQRLGYMAVAAADPTRLAEDTANNVGSRIVGYEDDTILMSSNSRHAEYIIHKGNDNSHSVTGLEAVDASAIDEVERRAKHAGLEIVSRIPSRSVIEKSVTFMTTEGHIFEVHTPMPFDRDTRYLGPGLRPKFIDHVNYTAADPVRWSEEIHQATGMLLTERTTGSEISWMRAADGRHHTVAVVKSDTPGLHHTSWEYNSFDDFKGLADALLPEGRQLVWGPGRHGAGDNLFLYFTNSANFLVECTAEMELIHDYYMEPRVVDAGENLSNATVVNQWGQLPPIEWVQHHTQLSAEADYELTSAK